jgi:hypothetical protein
MIAYLSRVVMHAHCLRLIAGSASVKVRCFVLQLLYIVSQNDVFDLYPADVARMFCERQFFTQIC